MSDGSVPQAAREFIRFLSEPEAQWLAARLEPLADRGYVAPRARTIGRHGVFSALPQGRLTGHPEPAPAARCAGATQRDCDR